MNLRSYSSHNLKTRIEKDSMGELSVPIDAMYGAQTQRAIENFKISGHHGFR